jgi:hypothetical protein
MSSLNDGSGPPTSQNNSIPLEDEESSLSIYSDEEREGSDVLSDELTDVGQSSLDYSSVSRTYLSQSQSRSRGAARASDNYTGTASYYSNADGGGGGAGSNSYGYDDEDYEYSSGYDSMTYGNTSLRSPHSELSSTFASFYYENEFVVKARSTLRFLRRPLYYFAFATAGSGAVGSVFRLATTMVQRNLDSSSAVGVGGGVSLGVLSGSAGGGLPNFRSGISELPSGYPDVPAWLQEVRASLPTVLEVSATWLLRRNNIPVLSDLINQQQQQQHQLAQASLSTGASAAAAASGLASHVGTGVQEAWQSWQKSGPAIPVALFLPLFSVVAIKIARLVRPNPHSVTELLRAQQEAEDAEVASAYLSTTSLARPMNVGASPTIGAAGVADGTATSSSAGKTSALSSSADVPPTSRGGGAAAAAATVPPQVPPVNIAGVTRTSLAVASASPEARLPPSADASAASRVVGAQKGMEDVTPPSAGVTPGSTDGFATEPRERSRSATQAPQTHRHGVTEEDMDGEDIDVDTGARLMSSPSSADREGKGLAYDAAAKPPSPPPQRPQPTTTTAGGPPSVAGSAATTSSSTQGRGAAFTRTSTLRGDVVAAVAGTPDVREANVALLAAARYGCSAVLLPVALEHAVGLLEAPPSLGVSFVRDVVVSAMNYADRRGLTLLGVTAQQWDAQSLPLDTFVHPMNSLYLFVSREAENPAAVAAMEGVVLQSVYVGTTRSELPANQVFYDRLQKERAAAG